MSSDEAEYVVESITAARIKKRGRFKVWEYRVRWQGYAEEDDTWEPVSSFKDSSHFIENFWERASKTLNGRNIMDVDAFKVGDQFFPVGPPLKKRKSQRAIQGPSPIASGSNIAQSPKQTKRPRTLTPTTEQPSPKRKRLSANLPEKSPRQNPTRTLATEPSRRSGRKPQKEPSIVPPSEGEDEEIEIINGPVVSEEPSRSRNQGLSGDSITQSQTEEPLPVHRARMANPLVKPLGDLEALVGTPAKGKGRDTANAATSSPPATKRRKPGPGRSSEGLIKSKSSLLTFEKGKLKSVKGKFVAPKTVAREEPVRSEGIPIVVDESPPPQPPPTGEELLQLAAQGVDTKGLQNFEEGEDALEPNPSPSNDGSSLLQRSLSLAKESLFPSSWSQAAIANVWNKRPTIFGPPGLGSDTRPAFSATNSSTSEGVQTPPFSLVLDVTSKLPVALTALSSTDPPILDKIVRNASKGPPGKFYSSETALSILDTFRTGGASAKVVSAPDANESEIRDFEKFSQRLGKDELFVFMVGYDLLVFCSSSSSLITQRLNFPSSLLSEVGSVLVERVSIANHSAYANAAMQVDSVPW